MKLPKTLAGLAFAVALMVGSSALLAGQSCCVKAKAKGKECDHECCVKAHKEHKLCEKCQKEASCCDKAIAKPRNARTSAARKRPKSTKSAKSAIRKKRRKRNNLVFTCQRPNRSVRPLSFARFSSSTAVRKIRIRARLPVNKPCFAPFSVFLSFFPL